MTIGVVLNPAAGNGGAGRYWTKVAAKLSSLGPLDVKRTGGPGDARDLARQLAIDGAELVIATGGDGTVSEVACDLLQAREMAAHMPGLAVVPAGRGSDFARGLKLDTDIDGLVQRLAMGERRTIDAGRVCYINDQGAHASRHFINIASLGVSGAIDRSVNAAAGRRHLSGKLLFLAHTVRELLRYEFQDVRVTVDDGEPIEARIALVAIANAPYFGGGMKIAPAAVPDDAMLEVVIIKGRSKLSLLKDLRLVYSGAHTARSSCIFLRGSKIVVEPLDDPSVNAALLDVDGETPGRIPAMFEVLPGAITLRG